MKSILVIGAGGLGSPALLHLASAGYVRIGIADFDRVELSNLPRQILYGDEDVGRPKTEAARERLRNLPGGRSLAIETHPARIRGDESFLSDYDVVIDAADGAETKFALHDAVVRRRIPFVHAGVLAWNGQALSIRAPGCLRCLFGDFADPDPPDGRRVGIVGPLAGLVGLLAADEALALAEGRSGRWDRRFWRIDGLAGRSGFIGVRPRSDCPVCAR